MTGTLRTWTWPLLAMLSGWLAMLAVWVSAALLTDRSLGWMAWVLALDLLLLLRMAQAPRGWTLRLIAATATAVGCAVACWLLVSAWFGLQMGLDVMESAPRMGPVLARVLLEWRLSDADVWFVLSAPLLAFVGAGWAGVSARHHPAP